MPQHSLNKPHPAKPNVIDAGQQDLVPGSPPVPITVWRSARTESDTAGQIGARLAARLVAAYSRPGEAVVDLTDGHALTYVCTTGGRQHHPAWFSGPASLIIGPATATDFSADSVHDRPDEGDELPELHAWFGDDLTDANLPFSAGPAAPASADGDLRGMTSLLVARWPLDSNDAANRVRLAWLLTACAQLLRPGGCLILVVTIAPGTRPVPEDFSEMVTAAAGVRLGYLQHIVAVSADTDGDAFIYHVTDEELLAMADDSGQWQAEHLRVHADLLVFSQINQPSPRPRPGGHRGGGRRG
ncbi:hypothetical protein [Actinoplanes sp. M2I2]|uniref:hypothetical protein n=1 Tax=Actinoplanes sp. M2I2 TaxID=1734444 RepID=UPI0035B018BF